MENAPSVLMNLLLDQLQPIKAEGGVVGSQHILVGSGQDQVLLRSFRTNIMGLGFRSALIVEAF